MKHPTKWLDTNEELHVFRSSNGIQLIRPDKKQKHLYLLQDTGQTVGSLLQFPCNVYFLNTESKLQSINEGNAALCGAQSIQDCIGKSVIDFLINGQQLLNNDQETMKTNRMQIIEEYCHSKNDIYHMSLSIKMPWYNTDGKIIGIMGFGILLNKQSLSDSLKKIAALGLLGLPSTTHNILPGTKINNTYLSKPKTKILHYTVRGNTAKRISRLLGLSPRTIEKHLENIKMKMNSSSKEELIEKIINHFNQE